THIYYVNKNFYFGSNNHFLFVVDYILLDPAEQERLSVSAVPWPFPSRVIRAPVPWSESYREAHSWQTENLCTVNPMMLHVQDLWMSSFTSLRFVRLDDLLSADLPLLPAEFEELVRRQCQNTRDELLNTWLPRCASLFVTFKDSWLPLVPKKASISPVKAQKLFYSVAALMSLQLRGLVVASLQDLLQFFQLHQDGNDFGEYFDELKYTQRPLLLVKLRLEDPKITFEPSLESCWELIQHAFTQIIDSAHNIPRVECKLFSEVGETLMLCSVRHDEMLVTDIVNRAREIFQWNTVGPQRYLDVYKKYTDLLDRQDILNFLKAKHSLQGFTKKITGVQNLWTEIASLHVTVPLSLICLDAVNLNQDLCDKADHLVDLLTTFVMEENRELNKRWEETA
uniref:Dynein heavy chain linker domain-containing protein n=1 Tax=Sinocyclocheilus anshuiensis TaxID=1608454 RepID=A0A671RBC6_9TELE